MPGFSEPLPESGPKHGLCRAAMLVVSGNVLQNHLKRYVASGIEGKGVLRSASFPFYILREYSLIIMFLVIEKT